MMKKKWQPAHRLLWVFWIVMGCGVFQALASEAGRTDAQPGVMVAEGADGFGVTVGEILAEVERRQIPQDLRLQLLQANQNIENLAKDMYVRKVVASRARETGLRLPDASKQAAPGQPEAAEMQLAEMWWGNYLEKVLPQEEKLLAYARTRYNAMSAKEREQGARARLIRITVASDEGDTGADAAFTQIRQLREEMQGIAGLDELVEKVRLKGMKNTEVSDMGVIPLPELESLFGEEILELNDTTDLWTQIKEMPGRGGYALFFCHQLLPAGEMTFEEMKPQLLASLRKQLAEQERVEESARILKNVDVKEAGVEEVLHKVRAQSEAPATPAHGSE